MDYIEIIRQKQETKWRYRDPRSVLLYERDVNESKCLKISREGGGEGVRVMVFNATSKHFSILKLTVADEEYSRNAS